MALGAVTQTATGFGFSLVSAPFLVAAYRAPAGVQITVALSLFVNLAVLAREHRRMDVRAVGLMIVPAVAVAVPLGHLVRNAPPGPATVIAGLVCLAAVATLAAGRHLHGLDSRAGRLAIGAVSGGMNATAGMSGPPVALFAANARWPLAMARPTMQLFFFTLNLVTILSLGWPHHMPLGVVAGFVAGLVTGALVAGRLSDAVARPATLVLAAMGSVLAIARGLAG